MTAAEVAEIKAREHALQASDIMHVPWGGSAVLLSVFLGVRAALDHRDSPASALAYSHSPWCPGRGEAARDGGQVCPAPAHARAGAPGADGVWGRW